MLKLITTLLVIGSFNEMHSLNILGVFPSPAKSHFFVFQPYLQELARRGHNVTVISYFAQKQPIENYHDIDLSENAKVPDITFPPWRSSVITFVIMSAIHMVGGPYTCQIMLSDENVQDLWNSQRKFDVVVVEQFDSSCGLGLAYKLGAPVVGITSHMLLPWHYNKFGVPYNPSYVLFDFVEGGTKPTLMQRVQRTIWYNYFNFINKHITQRLEQNIIAAYLNEVPPLEDLVRDIKFILLYQSFVLTGSSLLPSNVKEVGGYHVKEPKPLPDDIQKFIEESEHGVIYISFGSILKTSLLAQDQIENIIAALEEFPQRVIWKWERKRLPSNPKNIYISKWLPQNDILAHPKVMAFFSHCGLLGTTEATYHAVPILGMPIFGDQPSNAAAIEEIGLGVQIHTKDLTKEKIVEKLKTVLDPKFRERVKSISKTWLDRPVSAMDSAIYWTEYAARYSNLTFRSHSADVPLYQYLCLDILLVLTFNAIALIICAKYLLVLCLRQRPKHKKKGKTE